jgi:Skp family chaperone for outer membrane proteins
MNMKLTVAVVALLAAPVFAHAQKAAPKGAKPTAADAQKILQAIGADQAKVKIYCDASKIFKQIDALDQKKDKKKIDDLFKQGDALEAKLGPDYVRLTTGMQQIDSNSQEGKDIGAAFSALDKQCGA